MNRAGIIALAALIALPVAFALQPAPGQSAVSQTNAHLRQLTDTVVTFRIGDQAFNVTLYDNPSAHDLLAQWGRAAQR